MLRLPVKKQYHRVLHARAHLRLRTWRFGGQRTEGAARYGRLRRPTLATGTIAHSRSRDRRSRSTSRHYSRRRSPPSSRGDTPSLARSRHRPRSLRSRYPQRSTGRRRARSPLSRRSSTQNVTTDRSSRNNSSAAPLPVASPIKSRRAHRQPQPPPDVERSVEDAIIRDACGRYWHAMASTGLGFLPGDAERTKFAEEAFNKARKAAADAGKGASKLFFSSLLAPWLTSGYRYSSSLARRRP